MFKWCPLDLLHIPGAKPCHHRGRARGLRACMWARGGGGGMHVGVNRGLVPGAPSPVVRLGSLTLSPPVLDQCWTKASQPLGHRDMLPGRPTTAIAWG